MFFYYQLKNKFNRVMATIKITNIVLLGLIILLAYDRKEFPYILSGLVFLYLFMLVLRMLFKNLGRPNPGFLRHTYHIMDYTIITLVVYFTGGATSAFTLLYFFPVIRNSLMGYKFGGIKSAIFSSFFVLFFDLIHPGFFKNPYFFGDLVTVQVMIMVGWLVGKLSQVSFSLYLTEALNKAYHSGRDLRSSIELSLEALVSNYDASIAGIMLYNKETGLLTYDSIKGPKAEKHKHCTYIFGEGMPGECLRTGLPVISQNIFQDIRIKYKSLVNAEGILSFVSVPLKTKGQVIGVLNLACNYIRIFDEEDIFPLKVLTDMISNSIEGSRHEQANREVLNRNNAIFETVSNGIIVVDKDARISVFNREAQKAIGLLRDDALGKYLWDVLYKGQIKDEQGNYNGFILNALLNGHKYENHHIDWVNFREEKLIFEVDAFPLWNDEGEINGAVAIFKNVTQRMELEEQMQQAEKFAVIGQLAAGLAHEIRNPLTSVKGFVQLLQGRLLNEKNEEYLGYVVDELDRVNNLIKEFLLLAKPSAPRKQAINLEELLQKTVEFMKTEAILQDITINIQFTNRIPLIEVDWEQIKQVFINIIQNAFEAMSTGGQLNIRGKYLPRKKVAILEFEDNGIGIPRDMLKKVLNPFFTTKDDGSGLGLAVSYRIIESHGGTMKIKSTKGKGTTIILEIPSI